VRPFRPSILATLLAGALAGCAGDPPPTLAIAPGQYEHAFDVVRDELARARFDLDRVDARAGVITTRPKTTAGLATPWDDESVTLAQKSEDLLNLQQRRVRVTFEPAAALPASTRDSLDLRELDQPMIAHVEVAIDRVRLPGWELDATAIRYSGHTQNQAIVDRGLWPRYEVPFSQDDDFARRLASRVRAAMGVPATPSGNP
jgi:hypothetical protein